MLEGTYGLIWYFVAMSPLFGLPKQLFKISYASLKMFFLNLRLFSFFLFNLDFNVITTTRLKTKMAKAQSEPNFLFLKDSEY